MTSSRRLVAIMFTDIAGYTALMASDEKRAMTLLNENTRIHLEMIGAYRGELLKEIGDGILASFSTITDAVYSAGAIQNVCKSQGIRLRIGIHLGEVIFREGDIFGDGVNIASRIETIAEPGQILVSSNVYQNIQNKHGITSKSIGIHNLKGVSNPIRLYAISMEPGIWEQMREESVRASKNRIQRGIQSRWIQILLGILAIIAAYLLLDKVWLSNTDNLISQEIRESRIAVLPYENQTNDPALDALGSMASDYITQSLQNIEDIQIVSSETVDAHLEYASAASGGIGASPFMQRTGARKVIKGNFYESGGALYFHSEIVDLESGDVDLVLREVSGAVENPRAVIQELAQRVLGYYGSKEDAFAFHDKAPIYEAYTKQREAAQYWGNDYGRARTLYAEAIEIDSTYLTPYIFYIFSFTNQGRYMEADSIYRLLIQRFPSFLPYEKALVDWCAAAINRDIREHSRTTAILFEKDPKHPLFNYNVGLDALRLNRPTETVRHFSMIAPEEYLYRSQASTWWNSVYASALVRLEKYEQAKVVLWAAPEELATNSLYYRWQEIYVRNNEEDSLFQMIIELEDRGKHPNLINDLYIETAEEYALLGDNTKKVEWAQLAVERINNMPESLERNTYYTYQLAWAYYLAEDYESALQLFEQIIDEDIGKLWVLQEIGCIYAHLQQEEKARDIISQMTELEGAKGQSNYSQGVIFAQLGEKGKAVDLLKQAFEEGFIFNMGRYDRDYDALPLRGYEPWEEFVRPK